jgi:hypothetical protein
LHYPDLFGGIMPIDAAMGSGMGRADAEPPPAWMQPQIKIHSPANLYPNARNVGVFFKNAGDGIQRKSTGHTDGIVTQDGFSTAESFPGMPHNFGDKYAYALVVTTCDASHGVVVKTTNIDALTLRLGESPTPKTGALVIDGTTVIENSLPSVVQVSKAGGKWVSGPRDWPRSTACKGQSMTRLIPASSRCMAKATVIWPLPNSTPCAIRPRSWIFTAISR